MKDKTGIIAKSRGLLIRGYSTSRLKILTIAWTSKRRSRIVAVL